ncbi:thermonuclease family protein [Polymorphum gilvum]|uniref:Uncharacterized protein n=1 Tax=Polymorphum gilvum (strain LMG 25793 / CGMCC 1.9160 / SL003B-26A1) TaxID=991905 RepID=F2IY70_POLGS|nr:thermonuclease family protein [Polymorphum gilvum]ADZ71682.1 hypothetical protein SL003B_3260 [Polymorphum gilvum SL003B-26A1]
MTAGRAIVAALAAALLGALLYATPFGKSLETPVEVTASGDDPVPNNVTDALSQAAVQPEIGIAEAPPDDPAPLPQQIRNVSPEGASPPPVTGTLKRIAPDERLLSPSQFAKMPDTTVTLKRPVVRDAGVLVAGSLVVHLAHIVAPAVETQCTSTQGDPWPCGARARTELQRVIRLLAVECEKTADLGDGEIVAVCRRNRIDLGAWLLRNGWATPAPDAPAGYRDLETGARQARAGMWRSEEAADLAPAVEFAIPNLDLDGLLASDVAADPFRVGDDFDGATGVPDPASGLPGSDL